MLYSECCCPSRSQSENRGKRKEKYWEELYQRIKKAVEHVGNGDINCNWYSWNSSQRFGKGTGRIENWRMTWDHPNYSIIEIDQNTEKSPGDLRRLDVTQTPVKDHQLMIVWKTHKKKKLSKCWGIGCEWSTLKLGLLFHIPKYQPVFVTFESNFKNMRLNLDKIK